MHPATAPIPEAIPPLPAHATPTAPRKVSIRLAIFILLLPAVGAWFTLRKGYSQRAKIIAFSYMVLYILGNSSHHAPKPAQRSEEAAALASAQEPEQAPAAAMLTPRQANLQLIEQIDAKGGRCSAMAATLRHWQNYNDQSGNDAPFMEALGQATDMGC